MKRKSYRQFKSKLLKDREVKRAYERLAPEFSVISMIIEKRLERGISQGELARKLGTKQSAISRLESGSYNPSLSFLKKVSEALGAELKISLSRK
ncbi:MAG: helix-turn-helix transcriptional regulator [Candidatus Paceibacterota bacterium]|jgi:predicted transcriptional regulator